MSNAKLWNSLFVTNLVVDLPNYITEIILLNWCKRWNKPIPNCAFWRKEISEQSAIWKELRKRYIAELTQIKSLLKKYDYTILIDKLKKDKITTIRYLKKYEKDKFIRDLEKLAKEKPLTLDQKPYSEIVIEAIEQDKNKIVEAYKSQTFTINPSSSKINE